MSNENAPVLPGEIRSGPLATGGRWGIAPGCNGPETAWLWYGGVWFPASEEGPNAVIVVLRAAFATERARAASAERDRNALATLRDQLLADASARSVMCSYVMRQWDAAEMSEGVAASLLGVDRLTAREMRDAFHAAGDAP